MSQKIPSRLIVYRSSRLAELRQNNLKYAYFSPNFIYTAGRSFRVLQQRTLNLPKKDYISSVSFYLGFSELENNHLIRSLTSLCSLRRLSLTLSEENLETPDSELRTRKVLQKILEVCSRIKAFSLMIFAPTSDAQFYLKFLSFTKSMKDFTCTFYSFIEIHFENLANNLARTLTRCSNTMNSFYFIVDTQYDAENLRVFDWNLFANSLERIQSTVKNSQLDLELFPSHTDMENFLIFAQKASNLSILKHLSIFVSFSEDLLHLIKESKYLKKLSITLFSSSNSLNTPNLEISTMEPKSLSYLDLNLDKFKDVQYFPILFQQLVSSNPQLVSLTLSLQRAGGLPDSVLEDFTQSLGNFDKLRYLALHANILPPFSIQFTESTIKDFYKKLSKLKHLKELKLSFSNQRQAGSENIFGAFCESLKSLKELKSLKLNLASTDFTENNLIYLSNVLPDLNSLVLIFNGLSNQPVSAGLLKQFLASLVNLKNLSWLELDVKGKDIDEQHAKEFITSFWGMKSLDYLKVDVETASCDPSVKKYFKQQILQLRKRNSISISIKSA